MDKCKYVCFKGFCTGTWEKSGKVCWKAEFQSKTLQQAVSQQKHVINPCSFLLLGLTNSMQKPDVCGPIILAQK